MVVGVLGRGIVAADEPVVRADDLGLTRGDGCFESCRVISDAAGVSVVERLDAHLERLRQSLDALGIPGDVAACRELILAVAEHWTDPGEAVVKLMVTRGVEGAGVGGAGAQGAAVPTVVATVKPPSPDSLRQRHEGVRAVTLARGTDADTFTDAPWLLGGVKSLSYALNMAAQREAVRRGAEDALWVASDGTVLEAPTATVVWAVGNRLATTPTGATGILAGTTMAALFDGAAAAGAEVGVDTIRADDLTATDGIWLVSAVRGVAEVVELDGTARARQPERTARYNAYAGFQARRPAWAKRPCPIRDCPPALGLVRWLYT
jgi:4-amino-4-deoxychorismate lyase